MTIQDVAEHELVFPTPRASDGAHGGPNQRGSSGDLTMSSAVHKLLSTPDTLPDAPNTGSNSHKAGNIVGLGNQAIAAAVDWGPYTAAIRRAEGVLGRPAPPPVRYDGRNGKPRLNPELPEFMMGWPEGYVTDPAIWEGSGLTPNKVREAQLRAIGNGVATLQAVLALRHLLNREGVPNVR